MRQIQCFVVAAELQNFTAAGAELHLSQPALSRQIATLESELGVRLFLRTGRRVVLSPEGARILPKARQSLRQFADLKAYALDANGAPLEGVVTVGTMGSIGPILAPLLIDRVALTHPGLRLSFVEGFTRDIEALIAARKVDVGIHTWCGVNSAIEKTELFQEAIYLVSTRDKAPSFGRSCSLAQALSLPLVTVPSTELERQMLDDYSAGAGCRVNIAHEVTSMGFLIALAKRGHGHLLLPAHIADYLGSDSWVFTEIEGATVKIVLSRRRLKKQSPAVAAVMAMIMEVSITRFGARVD